MMIDEDIVEKLNIEVWKDIEGYEGYYQVSNLGKVISVERQVRNSNKSYRTIHKHHVATLQNNSGYLTLELFKSRISKRYLIHRLVWSAFNGKIPEGMQINHINENKLDNRLENLELVTAKENANFGTRNSRMINNRTGNNAPKIVLQYDLDGNLINEWKSASEVERVLGINSAAVGRCARKCKYYKTYKGYVWRYK